MARSALSRCVFSANSLFSFTTPTSSVCRPTHRRCSSLLSFSVVSASRVMFLIVASIGPEESSSPAPAVLRSYSRLSRSTSAALLSASSLRREISISYFSTARPFSASSAFNSASVSSSFAFLARTFSASTRVLAMSFCRFVVSASAARIARLVSRVASAVLCTPFSTVVCSDKLANMRSSWSRTSTLQRAASCSAILVSLSRRRDVFLAASRCASVSSSAEDTFACVSANRSFFSRHRAAFFSKKSHSVSTFLKTPASCSFLEACSFTPRRVARVSASSIVASSFCASSASRVARSASSRLEAPTSALFH